MNRQNTKAFENELKKRIQSLGEWRGKTPIQIFFLVFADNIAGEYLSLIEDVLWAAYRPLFGKKGPR
jgi:hypothetical protein